MNMKKYLTILLLTLISVGCVTIEEETAPTGKIEIVTLKEEIDSKTGASVLKEVVTEEIAERSVADKGASALLAPQKYATPGRWFYSYDIGGQSDILVASIPNKNEGTKGADLWKMSGGMTRLTNSTYYHFSPSVSKWGNKVYFVSKRGNPGVRNEYIWRMPAGTAGGITRIGSPAYSLQGPDESPDGENILYTSRERKDGSWFMWHTTKSGNLATQLGVGANASWMNKQQILYEHTNENTGRKSIWRVNKDGSERTELISDSDFNCIQPSADPLGRYIAYIKEDPKKLGRSRDVYIYRLADGLSQQITTNTSRDDMPRWSNIGSFLFFRSTRGVEAAIWRLDSKIFQQ